MSLFFLANNVHFTLEILGALVFLMVAWLAFDAFRIRKDFLTASRSVGFALLAIWQILHAFNLESDLTAYLAYLLLIAGLVFAALNLLLEKPIDRPEFKAVIILPGLAVLAAPLSAVTAALMGLIAILAHRQFKKEQKKALVTFRNAFVLLFIGYAFGVFYGSATFGTFWLIGHLFEFLGFASLAWWVWQYLQTRLREEMILIFFSMGLLISTIVTLAFSTILINQTESVIRSNLLTNAKVLDLTIDRLKAESLAKAKFLAEEGVLTSLLARNEFVDLRDAATDALEDEDLGFLTIVDTNADVVLRAHALTQKEDSLEGEAAVTNALRGDPFATIERSPVEDLSVRAAAPLISRGRVIGAVVVGFPLDNILMDKIRKVTGLEMSVFSEDTRISTTALNPDGKTRSTGIRETNKEVLDKVLSGGQSITLRTTLLSRPFLASYLPIRDSNDSIIGMLSSAKPQQEIADLANATNRLTLVTVVIITLILIIPIYFITRRLLEQL